MHKLVLLWAFMAPLAIAQAAGSAVQTITPADLSPVVSLDGPWRFHAGDDPRFADPNFDDSSWPAIRPNQPFNSIGMPPINGGSVWTRIRLRTPMDAGRLALAIDPTAADAAEQYQVFVNGSPIASTPGMATRTIRFGSPFPVALPQSGDMVLALRFYEREGIYYWSLPFTRVSIGSVGAIQAAANFDRLRAFNDRLLADYVCLCITLLTFITAIILYRSQRDHDEYLWLGVFSLNNALYQVMDIAVLSGRLPLTTSTITLLYYAGWFCMVTGLEFVMRFTRIRRRWPIRIVQAALLIAPALGSSPSTSALFAVALVLAGVALLAIDAACLISGYRRGQVESGLLLIPVTIANALCLVWAIAGQFPAVFPWGGEYHFGPVGIAGDYLGLATFSLGIMAVVIYRFVRVARDEQRAAAELEAARTVKQILVPEEIPTIPGFAIQAVYHPAGQVGGDFYQVLPTSNGGLLAIIGDVSGKGMPAAMTVSLLVGTVRTLAHFTQDPTAILTAMNQRMIGRGSGFTTALVLRLDPGGTLTAANAGHLAPYANGTELAIDNGLPLGITAAAAYTNSTLHLESGTTLTLITDGVVEAQNGRGELFGFDRTREISTHLPKRLPPLRRLTGKRMTSRWSLPGWLPSRQRSSTTRISPEVDWGE